MKNPSKRELDLAIHLTRLAYDSIVFLEPQTLVDILNSEYDWQLKPEDVKQYINHLSMDEEDYRLIYNHML